MNALSRMTMGALRLLGVAPAIEERARVVGGRGPVMPEVSLWMQFQRLQGGMTPDTLSRIMRNADTGHMRRLMEQANEARQKDGHLQGILSVCEETISGLDWQLKLPDNARAKDKRAMKWVESVMRQATWLKTTIAHHTGAAYYGYAVSELTDWKKVEGKLVPGDARARDHRRFGYRAEDGRLVWTDLDNPNNGVDFRADFPGRFIVSEPRVTGDVRCREGLCRPLLWMALFRNWCVTDWLRTGEYSWKPYRIGKFKGNSNTEDREALEEVLARLTTQNWAVLPENVDLEVFWPQNAATSKVTHSELYNVLAQEMSKCALGQTETTQASSSSGYAQAKVHQEMARQILESRAKSVAFDLTRDLITTLIRMNFGVDYAVPTFEFSIEDATDIQVFADAIVKLVGQGLKVSQQWVRDQIGAPEPKDDEDLMGLDSEDGEDGEDEEEDGEKPPTPDAPDPKEPTEEDEPETEEEDKSLPLAA